jgi:hypothetical protein
MGVTRLRFRETSVAEIRRHSIHLRGVSLGTRCGEGTHNSIKPITFHRSSSRRTILRIREFPAVPSGVGGVHEGGGLVVVSERAAVGASVGVVHGGDEVGK